MIVLSQSPTASEAAQWLTEATGSNWSVSNFLDLHLTPYVEIETSPEVQSLGWGAHGSIVELCGGVDIARLAFDKGSMPVEFFRGSNGALIRLQTPQRVPVAELRYQRADVQSIASAQSVSLAPPAPPVLGETTTQRNRRFVDYVNKYEPERKDGWLTRSAKALNFERSGLGKIIKAAAPKKLPAPIRNSVFNLPGIAVIDGKKTPKAAKK